MGSSAAQAAVSLATTSYATYQQQQAQQKAAEADKRYKMQVSEQQTLARREEQARNTAQATAERRTQLREERVRRSKILQSSVNSGVTKSSGEAGAVGGLSTQLGSNIGTNLGEIQAAANISQFQQNAANIVDQTQSHLNSANNWGQIGQVSQSIFAASGGFNPLIAAGKEMTNPDKAADPKWGGSYSGFNNPANYG